MARRDVGTLEADRRLVEMPDSHTDVRINHLPQTLGHQYISLQHWPDGGLERCGGAVQYLSEGILLRRNVRVE